MISVKPYTVSVSWIRKGRERLKGDYERGRSKGKMRYTAVQYGGEAERVAEQGFGASKWGGG